MRLGVARFQREGARPVAFGLLQQTEPLAGVAEIVMRLGIVAAAASAPAPGKAGFPRIFRLPAG